MTVPRSYLRFEKLTVLPDSSGEASRGFEAGASEAFREPLDSPEVDEDQQRPHRSWLPLPGILPTLGRLFCQVSDSIMTKSRITISIAVAIGVAQTQTKQLKIAAVLI